MKSPVQKISSLLLLLCAWCSTSAAIAATCEYVVVNDWGSGAQASIRITNNGAGPINGWEVNWEYSDGTVVTDSWNAEISGDNPYTANNLSWNGNLQPDQFAEVGLQVSNGADSASVPAITGSVCDGGSSSSSSSSSSGSGSSSSSSSSSSGSGSSSGSSSSSSSGSSSGGGPSGPPPAVTLERAFPNLTFNQPLGLMQAPGDDSRWYVLEKTGTVYWIDANDNATATKNTYLDLSGLVDTAVEGGVLGMAFHPDYQSNGQVFLSFTTPASEPMTSVIARFTESSDGASLNAGSRLDILTLPQPYANHNGGHIAFGHDGYLYIGFGDGGSANDPEANSQDTSNWHGAMLRIDVDSGSPYTVPADNPFVSGGGLPEIYAYGLRNPWRWSFDKVSGDLWLADVGQSGYEEINVIESGGNYGWRCREGFHTTSNSCNTSGPYDDPVFEYDHGQGQSVTGGYVYRGSQIAGMHGAYIFGDYVSGRVWAYTDAMYQLVDTELGITSFGESNSGEIYLVDIIGGALYRIAGDGGSSSSSSSGGSSSSGSSSSSGGSSGSGGSSSSSSSSGSSSSGGGSGNGVACAITYENVWGDGYQFDVTVSNAGTSAVSSWEIALQFSEAPQITNSWNVDLAVSGNTVSASNVGWNGVISPGDSVEFGFQGDHDGSFDPPDCQGSGGSSSSSSSSSGGSSSSSSGSGSSSGSSSSGGTGNMNGGEIYAANCAGCHGFAGDGGRVGVPLTTPQDLDFMIGFIENNMPMGRAEECGAECAERVGNYIADTFWEDLEPLNCEMVRYGARQLKLLTRAEYQNTVEDLLGVNFAAAESLAEDSQVGYFINNAHASMVTSTYDRYLTAAEEIAAWSAARDFSPALNCSAFNQSCVDQFIGDFAPKLFRRPLDTQEVATYSELANGTVTEGDVQAGMQLALMTMLSSPQFLYRHELGEANPANSAIDMNAFELTSHEMATWLSYSFTGSTPDDIALQKAANDQLRDPVAITEEAQRLLDLAEARDTMGDFVGSWLGTDSLENAPKDPAVWPGFEEVAPHMEREIREVFAEVMLNDNESFASLYDANWTFVNGPLAQHYGISGVSGDEFQQVTTSDRGGILTSGAFMARWAELTETSPIRRSVRVRRRMLCQDQPDPPAGITESRAERLEELADLIADPATTNRMKYEALTSVAPCLNCHQEWINPLGGGMEDFDAVGNPRSVDHNGNLIDASGALYAPDVLSNRGESIAFEGSRGLGQLLATLPAAQSCVSQNMFRFMLGVGHDGIDNSNPEGRALDPVEEEGYACTVNDMTDTLVQQSPRAMLENMSTLDAVRYRKEWQR